MIEHTKPIPPGITPSGSVAVGHDRLEDTLRQAYVHVSRYFRVWLREEADREALAEELSVEALVRIAHMPLPLEGCADLEVIACWLSVARDVAHQVIRNWRARDPGPSGPGAQPGIDHR